MGQIDFGEFMEMDGLAVKFDFVAGQDWNVAGGELSGEGQHSFKAPFGSTEGKKRIVWNLPFEITYRSMSPFGWP